MAPLLAQLITMVNDLGLSVTFLTLQVETLTSAQAERSATALTTGHIQPGGIPQGLVLSCCGSLLTPRHTSDTPASSSTTPSRPCCPN